MNKLLIVRVDANTRMGTGHLMRCLALAQAWKDSGGKGVFVTARNSKSLLERLGNEGFSVHVLDKAYPDPHDWEVTKEVLDMYPDAWVVLDGYHFDPAYQQRVKEAGHQLLVIDDMAHLEHYYADIVLNQNLHAEQLNYSCEPYTQLLLGTQYVLLRREFLQWQSWKREIPEVARKVLVTLGGGDPDNATLKIIKAMNKVKLQDLEVKVVIGSSNLHMASLKEAVHHSPFTIHLLPSVENMPELMAWADVAISSGGTTCWEMAFMGLPAIVGQIAQVENLLVSGLKQLGLFLHTGWFAQLSIEDLAEVIREYLHDKDWRTRMSRLGQETVDGSGCARVLKSIMRPKRRGKTNE